MALVRRNGKLYEERSPAPAMYAVWRSLADGKQKPLLCLGRTVMDMYDYCPDLDPDPEDLRDTVSVVLDVDDPDPTPLLHLQSTLGNEAAVRVRWPLLRNDDGQEGLTQGTGFLTGGKLRPLEGETARRAGDGVRGFMGCMGQTAEFWSLRAGIALVANEIDPSGRAIRALTHEMLDNRDIGQWDRLAAALAKGERLDALRELAAELAE